MGEAKVIGRVELMVSHGNFTLCHGQVGMPRFEQLAGSFTIWIPCPILLYLHTITTMMMTMLMPFSQRHLMQCP